MERSAYYLQIGIANVMVIVILMTSYTLHAQEYPEMIEVKGGSFVMGDESGDKDEKPAHEVQVNTFRIAKTETTVRQWRTFCTATKRAMPEAPWFGLKDDHPIVNISWDDAIAYCRWLSTKDNKHYRLPTEAEWEFAARGGSKSKGYAYSGAKRPDSIAWFSSRSSGTMPVAQKLPNELGLYDMTGNVWEWCSDWYDAGYYTLKVKDNPPGPSRVLGSKFYTLRGGAWDIGARNSRNTYRNPLSPTSRNHNKGFRVACSD
jgi:formylglycine-generating enzyme required for sulfatase activity